MILRPLFIAAILAASTISANAGGYAWWLTKSYHPVDDAVAGIPVQAIQPGWTAIKTINRDTFSPDELAEVYESDDFNPTWEIKRDFNGDGNPDRVIVGVATSASKELHRFLLILTQTGPGGSWTKAYLTTTTTDRENHDMGFSYLIDKGDSIQWNDCFECDSGLGEIGWHGGEYRHR